MVNLALTMSCTLVWSVGDILPSHQQWSELSTTEWNIALPIVSSLYAEVLMVCIQISIHCM